MDLVLLGFIVGVVILTACWPSRWERKCETILLMMMENGTEIMVNSGWLERARYPYPTRKVRISRIERCSNIKPEEIRILNTIKELPTFAPHERPSGCHFLVLARDGSSVLCTYNSVMRAWRVYGTLNENFL